MLEERIATGVGPAKLELAYETRGDPSSPPVLLVMGIAAQLVNWPEGFLDALVKRGLYVVRFDNRDSGRSAHLRDAKPADLPAALKGDFSSASYTLSQMAADAVGLLDLLKLDSAHFVGASLGGAISQHAALEYPKRVRSLTSMMSTTGDLKVGQVHPSTMKSVFGGPRATTREEAAARAVRIRAAVGSPAYPADLAEVERLAALAWDRDHDEASVVRQAVASVASGDRTARLRGLDVPALIIHGLADTMCDPSGGRATAAAIPGAELVLIEGMGHDLPPGLWEQLADRIAANVKRGELLACGNRAADAMGQPRPSAASANAFFEEILHRTGEQGGRDLWRAFVEGLITRVELRNATMARFATWLSHVNQMEEPSSDLWGSPELERAFERALFG